MPEMLLLDEFLAEPDEPIRYRIQGCWPAGGRIVTAAQYKAGKTTLRDNMIKSLADGFDFLDKFQVHRAKGRVVVLDLEMDREQLKRWLRAHNIRNGERVLVIPMRGKGATLNLALPEVRELWATKLRSHEASTVILDCLRPVMDALGLDENRDAGKFLVWFDALLNEAGVAEANVIHHMGHGQERSRGDSRILDWPDATWTLVRKTPTTPPATATSKRSAAMSTCANHYSASTNSHGKSATSVAAGQTPTLTPPCHMSSPTCGRTTAPTRPASRRR